MRHLSCIPIYIFLYSIYRLVQTAGACVDLRNLFYIVALSSCTLGVYAEDDLRKAAVNRQRNIIFNNDGDDAWVADAPATPEGFLNVRMNHIGSGGVNAVFYCTTQSFNSFTHNSQLTEVFTGQGNFTPNNRMNSLLAAGTDPLKLAVESCRKQDLEIFWTLRMNDIHDCFSPELLSQWKRDNPNFLVGEAADVKRFPPEDPRSVWTFVDFSRPQVRDRVVEIIEDVINRYDVDGIDLDFMRHTCYFKETAWLQPVTTEHLAMMTEMVRKISQVVKTASREKGKPLLLSARIFPTMDLNRHFGFDLEQWLKSGYLDFIAVGGGYDPFTMPAQDMIKRGHQSGMPVYVCLSASGMEQRGVAGSAISAKDPSVWRAAAANAWASGADGIMTFNLFPQLADSSATQAARLLWEQMSDPKKMVGKDKLYCIENLGLQSAKGYMMRSVPYEERLPVVIARGASVIRVLPVADDIKALNDQLKALRLRIYLAELKNGDQVEIQLNGKSLPISAEKPGWLAADLSSAFMIKGPNKVSITYREGDSPQLTVGSVELAIHYNP